MSSTLIKNGTLVTASDAFKANLLIADGRIAAITRETPAAQRVIDAAGKFVLPGGIDVHTHLNTLGGPEMFTADDFYTGHRAAAFGGTTCHIQFADQFRGQSMRESYAWWRDISRDKAVIDYGFHLMIIDPTEGVLGEIAKFREWGVNTIKVMMAYKGRVMLNDDAIFKVMRLAKQHGCMVLTHCENGEAIDVLQHAAAAAGHTAPIHHALTRPPELEAEATERAIQLAQAAGGAPLFVVHCSHTGALQAVVRARARGEAVWAETCTQYLFFTKDKLRGKKGNAFEGAKYVCSPPLRESDDMAALWQGLASGDVHSVSTDHCPWRFDVHKSRGRDNFMNIPNGVPGIEERLMMLWDAGVNSGLLSPSKFVELTSTAPAQLFGLRNKGALAIGHDADVVVWDPAKKHTIRAARLHGNMDYSLFEGMAVTGKPSQVFSRGDLLVDGDEWLGAPGRGQFVMRGDAAQ
jgi:dihydropyrimidinase